MDWVHCNSCAVQPEEGQKKNFFLTECGHIFCDECFEPHSAKECPICRQKCKSILLSQNMGSEIENYFVDPIHNFKKNVTVLAFQNGHRLRLLSFYREKIRQYKTIEKKSLNLEKELKLSKEHINRLQEEIKRIKTDFSEFKKKQGIRFSTEQTDTQQPNHIFSPFISRESPKSGSKSSFDDSLKRPPGPNFFFMTEKKSASQPLRKNVKFTPPNIPKYPGGYRSNMSASDISTPSTSDTIPKRFFKTKDPFQRRVNLPSGPSPTSRLGIQGLSFSSSMLTSTPKKISTMFDRF